MPIDKFFATREDSAFAYSICQKLRCTPIFIQKSVFPNGEKQIQLPVSIEGETIFLLQNFSENPDEKIFEALQWVDAAKYAGAKSITLIFPYYPYARQDRITKNGCAIPSRLIAKLFAAAGADQILTIDMHASEECQNFPLLIENISIENLQFYFLEKEISSPHKTVLFAADRSILSRVKMLATRLGCDWGYADKQRLSDGSISLLDFQGFVRNKQVYIIDDVVDTGRTIEMVTLQLQKNGAQSVKCIVTHGVCRQNVLNNLKQIGLKMLIETDTLPVLPNAPFVKILPVAPLIIETIKHQFM